MSAESSAEGMARLAMGLHEASEKVEDTRTLGELLMDEYKLWQVEQARAKGIAEPPAGES